jgi:hypothetical protein
MPPEVLLDLRIREGSSSGSVRLRLYTPAPLSSLADASCSVRLARLYHGHGSEAMEVYEVSLPIEEHGLIFM